MIENALAADEPDQTDDVFRALASERRRAVLRSLHRTGRLSPAELTATVALGERGGGEGESAADRTVRRHDLHHCAVPALARAGLVERGGDAVSLSPLGDHVASWLDEAVKGDERTTRH